MFLPWELGLPRVASPWQAREPSPEPGRMRHGYTADSSPAAEARTPERVTLRSDMHISASLTLGLLSNLVVNCLRYIIKNKKQKQNNRTTSNAEGDLNSSKS